ncbi:FliH/SctL family protein [Lysinimonas soli]|uniref:FliH/SctL family protein n=1 Tax=Lysinimonas soli TaxID=1074233 RepID=A0ABW0NU12_9MICO
MSADTAFSELRYPAIASAAGDDDAELARVRGHAAGYAAGLRAAESHAAIATAQARAEREALHASSKAALSSAVDALGAAVARLAEVSAPVLADADAALLAAAIELAESILGRELADGDASARAAIARALAAAEQDSITAVRLNPADLAVLRAHGIGSPPVRLLEDPTLSRGDAVVEILDARIDARISSALDRARAAIGALP